MNEILLEYTAIEDMVRVAAIDDVTGTEAVIVGPASAGREALGQVAAQKLTYVLSKRMKPEVGRSTRPGYWA